MNSKFKLVLGASALIMLIAISVLLYNTLIKNYSPQNSLTQSSNQQGASQSEEKTPAPDFKLVNFDGEAVRFSDYIGKPIVINFLASWCPPCKEELPAFDKVAAEMQEDVVFMMINATDGSRETVDIAKKYLSDNAFTLSVYFVTELEGVTAYGINSFPTTIFIDKEGNVVTGAIGMIDEATLRKGIDMITQ